MFANGRFLYEYRIIRYLVAGDIDSDEVMPRFSPGSHFEMRFISFAVLWFSAVFFLELLVTG